MTEPNLEDLENLTAPHQFALLAHEWDLLDSIVGNGSQNLKNVAKMLSRVSFATETYGKELQKIVIDNPFTTDIEPMTKLLEMISQFITNLGTAALNLHAGISSHVTRAIYPTTTKIDSIRESTRKQSREFQTRLRAFRLSVERERPACLTEWQHFLRAHKAAVAIEKEITSQDASSNAAQKIMKLQSKQAELDQKTRLQKFKVRQQFSDFENLVKSKNEIMFREYGPEFYEICGALERAQTQSMRKVVATYTILPSLVSSYTNALQACCNQFATAKLTSSFVSKGIRSVIADHLKTRSVYRELDPFLVGLPCSAHMIQEGLWNEERNTFVLPRKENLELQDSILSDQCGFLHVLRENRWVRAFVRVEASELTAPDLGGHLIFLWMCKVQRLAPDEMQRDWCFKIYSATRSQNGAPVPPTILTVAASSQMERDKWLFMLENVVDAINSKEPVDDGPLFPKHGNYISDRDKEILESVFTDDMIIAKKLSQITAKRADADKLAISLVNLSALQGYRATQQLMRVFVETEVANSSSESLLFRTDSVTSKMLAIYVRETASAWLHSALFTSIGELVLDASDDGKSFEINPSALQPNLSNAELTALLEWAQAEGTLPYSTQDEKEKDKSFSRSSVALPRQGTENQNITLLKVQIKKNLQRLENAVSKILDYLIDSLRFVPRKLRWMLQMVQEVVLDKYSETRWSCVSAFVFLRFLCPTVSTATLWKDSSLPNARRNLLLVTKVLQSIANRSLFTPASKEAYMNLLNPYMRTELSRVDSFCHSFIWPSPPLRDSCVSDSPACLRLRVAGLATDFDFLHVMVNEIKQDKKRDELGSEEAPNTPAGESRASELPGAKVGLLERQASTPAIPTTAKKYATWTKPASHSASSTLLTPLTTANHSPPALPSALPPSRPVRSNSRPYPPPPLPPVPPPLFFPVASRDRSLSTRGMEPKNESPMSVEQSTSSKVESKESPTSVEKSASSKVDSESSVVPLELSLLQPLSQAANQEFDFPDEHSSSLIVVEFPAQEMSDASMPEVSRSDSILADPVW